MFFTIPIDISITEDGMVRAESGLSEQRMDKAVFEALYRETAHMLWAYIRRASGEAALADDIFQETFLRLLRAGLPQLDPKQMRAYLYRTATSVLTDHWRRARRMRYLNIEALIGEQAAEESSPGGDVMRFYRQLKPREQALLWLAYVEGFDHSEIAQALQLREGSVRVLLFRARRKMAGILTKEGFGPREGS
ncbi:MAG: RNA polymerase sigma factor [Acidobacteria bacterium]|nr:RNA polymerase sigma factor [Acidobacteriota bacterium]